MSLKMFEIAITNTRTRESASFLGQGETFADAWSDGTKNIAAAFRHKQDSRPHPPLPLSVTLPSGERVFRTIEKFNSDTPYDPATEKYEP